MTLFKHAQTHVTHSYIRETAHRRQQHQIQIKRPGKSLWGSVLDMNNGEWKGILKAEHIDHKQWRNMSF
jgi:hypothetical protein